MLTKIFNFIKTHNSDIVLAIAVALITVISYELGRASVLAEKKSGSAPLTQNADSIVRLNEAGNNQPLKPKDPTVVVSKKSKSKLYHFTYCPGAAKISAANRLTFPTEAAASAAGYTLAGNCQK